MTAGVVTSLRSRILGWRGRVVGPVCRVGVGWTVAGLIVVQAGSELFVVPALAGGSMPGVVALAVVLVTGTAARVALGGAVAWRLLRRGVDDGVVVRTIVAGVLAGLVITWVGGWLVVRPQWGPGQWAAELGRFVVAVGLWLPPCGWGAWRFARSDLAREVG